MEKHPELAPVLPLAAEPDPFADLPPYEPPTTGILSRIPASWVPYGELMRLHKPAGYYTFYFPHLYGTLYAALLAPSPPSFATLVKVNLYFLIGSILLRGAACTWNDALDAPFDRLNLRCRHRPCARGAVSFSAAVVFTAVQTIIGGAFLILLPPLCTIYAIPLTVLIGLYPLGKRFTNYPQILLGFTLAIGQFVGSAALDVDPLNKSLGMKRVGVAGLYLSNVLCAIVVDAVYAHQDLQDDIKAGVKSIAVAWQDSTKPLLWILTTIQVGSLAVAGIELNLGLAYQAVATGGTAAVSWTMVSKVQLDVPESCWWWFVHSIWFNGAALSGGLFASYLGLSLSSLYLV